MSLFLKDNDGYSNREFTDVSHSGYENMADHLVNLYNNGRVSANDTSGNTREILEYYGAKDLNELRTKRRGW